MTVRAFVFLCIACVAALAAATAVVLTEDRPETVAGSGERVFPGLLDGIDRLAAISVRTDGGRLTVHKTARGWGLKERGDYPVPFEKVRATVLGLAALEKTEPKTARPEGFARLGVEDVEAAGARSREVSLLDAQGVPLARLIVGKPAPGQGGEGGLYVRIPGEPRAWAVRGGVDPGADARDWVDRRLTDVPADDVVRISVRHPDGTTLTIDRSDGEAGPWALKELPKGSRIRRADDLADIAATLAGLTLEDLRPVTEVEFAADRTTSARFETRDGRAFGLDLVDLGDERWIRLALPAASAPAPAGAPPATAAWAYRVPAWKVSPLQRRLADLTDSPKTAP